MHHQRADGLPSGIPRIITEYGYSPFAARPEVDIAGAVLDADIAAYFLALGGDSAYLYGYEPSELIRELPQCNSWGNLTLLQSDSQHRVKTPVAAYWGTRLITQSWAQPGSAPNTIVATSATGGAPVASYALRRPDGRLSILLLNKELHRARRVAVSLAADGTQTSAERSRERRGALEHAVRMARGRRTRPCEPERSAGAEHAGGGIGTELRLPPLSITVVRTEGQVR